MGTMYTGQFNGVAVTAQQDFFQLEAIGAPVVIHAVFISQHTDVGDAEAEALLINLKGGITAAVTDDVTAVPLNSNITRANLSNLAVNETTKITTGQSFIHSEAWNIALPFVWLPTPEMRITQETGDAFVVELATTPADSITCNGTIYFEEL